MAISMGKGCIEAMGWKGLKSLSHRDGCHKIEDCLVDTHVYLVHFITIATGFGTYISKFNQKLLYIFFS